MIITTTGFDLQNTEEKKYIKYAYYFSDDSSCYGVSARPEHQPSQLLILCIQLQAHWPQHLNSDHSHRVLSNAPTDTKYRMVSKRFKMLLLLRLQLTQVFIRKYYYTRTNMYYLKTNTYIRLPFKKRKETR